LLALEQERRRDLERRMLELIEAEQRRIGQDLHDNVCSQLSGIECLCQALIREQSGLPGRVGRGLERMARLLRVAMEDARQLARGLSPSGGVEQGLLAGLKNLAERTRRTRGCRCVFRGRRAAGIPGDLQAMQWYRIAQEAVSNAIRHGHARHVVIELAIRGENVVLRVVDDGTGFALGAETVTGLGLMTMEVRARTLGGRLEVKPTRHGGTEVRCTVPQSLGPVRRRANR
jgi:signal transduction histidine kinase